MNIHVPAPELQSDIIAITGLAANLDRAKAGLLERVKELQAEQEDRVGVLQSHGPQPSSARPQPVPPGGWRTWLTLLRLVPRGHAVWGAFLQMQCYGHGTFLFRVIAAELSFL